MRVRSSALAIAMVVAAGCAEPRSVCPVGQDPSCPEPDASPPAPDARVDPMQLPPGEADARAADRPAGLEVSGPVPLDAAAAEGPAQAEAPPPAEVRFGPYRVAWATESGYASTMAVGGSEVALAGYFKEAITIEGAPLVPSTPGDGDIFLAKFTGAGKLVWARSLGGPMFDLPMDLDVAANGDVALVGFFGGSPLRLGRLMVSATGASTAFAARYNSAGEPTSAGALSADPRTAVLDTAGNLVIGGKQPRLLVTVDRDGGSLRVLSASNGTIVSLVRDRDFNLFGCGEFTGELRLPGREPLRSDDDAAFMFGLTPAGDVRWLELLGTPGPDYCRGQLAVDPGGDVYAAFTTLPTGSPATAIARFAGATGRRVWTRAHGPMGVTSLALDTDGAVVAVIVRGLLTELTFAGTPITTEFALIRSSAATGEPIEAVPSMVGLTGVARLEDGALVLLGGGLRKLTLQ